MDSKQELKLQKWLTENFKSSLRRANRADTEARQNYWIGCADAFEEVLKQLGTA